MVVKELLTGCKSVMSPLHCSAKTCLILPAREVIGRAAWLMFRMVEVPALA